jgi:hypothetical protein
LLRLAVLFAGSFVVTLWWCHEGAGLAPASAAASAVVRAGTESVSVPVPEPVSDAGAGLREAAGQIDVAGPELRETEIDFFGPVLDAAIAGDEPADRQFAIRKLASAPQPVAVTTLVEVLRISDDDSDRAAAIWALRQQDQSAPMHADILAALQEATRDPDPALAAYAASGLAAFISL